MEQGTRGCAGQRAGTERRGCGRRACDRPALLGSGSCRLTLPSRAGLWREMGRAVRGRSRHEAEAFAALEVPVRAEEAGLERWSAPDSAHLDGARSGAAGVAQREHVPPTLVECVCPAHPGLPCRHAHPAPGLPCRPARPAPELPCRHAHMPGAPPDHSLPVGRTSVPIPDLSRAVLRVPCSLHTWVEA